MILRRRRIVGAPGTVMPAAQRMPAMMSLSVPPHLPSTRTGRISVFQPVPATPSALFVSAAIRLETRVPCHELAHVDPAEGARRDVERRLRRLGCSHRSRRDRWRRHRGRRHRSRTAGWKRNRSRRAACRPATPAAGPGCSKRTPVSSTATTVVLLPTVTSHACSARVAADLGALEVPLIREQRVAGHMRAASGARRRPHIRHSGSAAMRSSSAFMSSAPSARSSCSTSVSVAICCLRCKRIPEDAPSFCTRALRRGGRSRPVAPFDDDLIGRRLAPGANAPYPRAWPNGPATR